MYMYIRILLCLHFSTWGGTLWGQDCDGYPRLYWEQWHYYPHSNSKWWALYIATTTTTTVEYIAFFSFFLCCLITWKDEGDLKISIDRSCADTPDSSYFEFFLRLVVFLFLFNSFLPVLFNSIHRSIGLEPRLHFLSFSFFFLVSFVWNRIQNGVLFLFFFCFHCFLNIHLCQLCRGGWQSKHSSSPMLFVLHCHHCVCVDELLSLVHFQVCFLFFCFLVIWQQNIYRTCDTRRGDYSIKTSAVVFVCPSPVCLCL